MKIWYFELKSSISKIQISILKVVDIENKKFEIGVTVMNNNEFKYNIFKMKPSAQNFWHSKFEIF